MKSLRGELLPALQPQRGCTRHTAADRGVPRSYESDIAVLVGEVVHLRQANIELAAAAEERTTDAADAPTANPAGAQAGAGAGAGSQTKSPARVQASWSASGRKRPSSGKRLRKKLTLENVRLRAELERWKRRDRQYVVLVPNTGRGVCVWGGGG